MNDHLNINPFNMVHGLIGLERIKIGLVKVQNKVKEKERQDFIDTTNERIRKHTEMKFTQNHGKIHSKDVIRKQLFGED